MLRAAQTMTAEKLTNQIIRLQRRRTIINRIRHEGKLTRETIAALWRTTQPANQTQLIRWAINEIRLTDQS